MNRKLLLFVLVLSVFQSFAQPKFRLLSFSGYTYDYGATGGFELVDTAHFYYSGNSGGVVVPNYYNPELNNNVIDFSRQDIMRQDLLLGFDTAYIQQKSAPAAGIYTLHNTYNSGKLSTSVGNYVFPLTYRTSDSFIYNGNLLASVWRNWKGNVSVDSFTYDSNGNLIQRVRRSGTVYRRCEYKYNSNNQLEEATWYNSSNAMTGRSTFVYANGLIVSETEEEKQNGWNSFQVRNHTYNGAGKLVETELLNGPGKPYARFNYSYDNAGNVVEAKRAFWETSLNAYRDYTRALWTYNNNNLPVYAESQHYDADSNIWYHRLDTIAIADFSDRQLNFYYQLYWPTNVTESQKKVDLNVYPIPAGNFVNINIEWNQAQAFTATIFNLEGRIVKQWKEEKTKIYAKTISLPELSPGNYFIRLEGEHEKAEKQIAITQQ